MGASVFGAVQDNSIAIEFPTPPAPPLIATIQATTPTASEQGPSPGVFTATLSSPAPEGGLSVNYIVTGTATNGQDYQLLTSPVLFAAGATSATLPVNPIPDALTEGNETVVVTLTTGSGYQLPTSGRSATVTIQDNPPPTATIQATDPTASEQGSSLGAFTVTLSSPAPAGGLSVNYTVTGTATSGQDYQPLTSPLTFAAGATSATLTVNPIPDAVTESNETVIVTLTTGSGYQVGSPSSATVTIADEPLSLEIVKVKGDGQAAIPGQALQPFVVQVKDTQGPRQGLEVKWAITKGQGSLSNASSVTDTQGQASSTLTPSQSGDYAVSATLVTTGQSVTFSTSVAAPLTETPGLTPEQQQVANALDNSCAALQQLASRTPAQQDLLKQCTTLATASPQAAAQGVAALTPEQATVPATLGRQISNIQLTNIGWRLAALRRGVRGISLSGLTLNYSEQGVPWSQVADFLKSPPQGGAASADASSTFERLGVFVSGGIDFGDSDRTALQEGFEFNTQGITAGADYRFTDRLTLGAAVGYTSNNVDIDANGGGLDANAWSLSLYGTYYATEQFYLEGIVNYGWHSFDQTRNIAYQLLGGTRTATADFDGSNLSWSLGAGYDMNRGPLTLGLYGRLDNTNGDIDSYQETGASGLNLSMESQDINSLTTALGARVSHAFSVSYGVLLPQAWVEWEHQFEDGADTISGVFIADPTQTSFAVSTDTLDPNYFRLGVGLSAQFARGRSAFLSYETTLGQTNLQQNTVTGGVRFEF